MVINHLPGTKLSPEVVLHRTLQHVDRIKSIVIIIDWDDDTVGIDYSQQKMSTLTYAEKMLTLKVNDVLTNGDPQ
jgi:hypothetical protein